MDSLNQSRASDPLYILTSTSYSLEETVVYEANDKGEITASDDYGCIAKRLGHEDWTNPTKAVIFVFPRKKYYAIKDFGVLADTLQILFERYDAEVDDEYWNWRYKNIFNKQLEKPEVKSFFSKFFE